MGLAKLDIDSAPIRRRHGHQLCRLGIEKRADPFQHLVGSRHGKGQLERVRLEPVFPLGLLSGIQAADQHVVVPAVDGPLGDFGVGVFVVEVWLLPDVEEDALGGQVGDEAELAAVEEDDCGIGLEGRDGEGGLEADLAAGVCGDDVVGAPVEFVLGGPPLQEKELRMSLCVSLEVGWLGGLGVDVTYPEVGGEIWRD